MRDNTEDDDQPAEADRENVQVKAKKPGRKFDPDKGITAIIPTNLGKIMESKRITQVELVEEMNADEVVMKFLGKTKLSRTSMSMLISGRWIPSAKMVAALGYFLKCEPKDLYEPVVLALIGHAGYPKEQWLVDSSYWKERKEGVSSKDVD